MNMLEHCNNEYDIIMRNDADMESLEPGMNKLVEDEDDNPDGIITDWEDTEFDAVLSTMSSAFKNPGKAIHIYIPVENDTEENWKTIGNTLGMSLQDLHHAKKRVTRVYRTYFKFDDDYKPSEEELQELRDIEARGLSFIPNDSLWNEPWPDAKPVEDYDGRMIKLGRLSDLKENDDDFFHIEGLDGAMLFYLTPDKDITGLLQKIENLLMSTEEVSYV